MGLLNISSGGQFYSEMAADSRVVNIGGDTVEMIDGGTTSGISGYSGDPYMMLGIDADKNGVIDGGGYRMDTTGFHILSDMYVSGTVYADELESSGMWAKVGDNIWILKKGYDETDFSSVISEISGNGGGTLYIPPGSCTISSKKLIDYKIHIIGAGNATILSNTSGDYAIELGPNSDGSVVESLKISVDNTTNSKGISLYQSNSILKNIEVEGNVDYDVTNSACGIYIYNAYGGALIESCTVKSLHTGLELDLCRSTVVNNIICRKIGHRSVWIYRTFNSVLSNLAVRDFGSNSTGNHYALLFEGSSASSSQYCRSNSVIGLSTHCDRTGGTNYNYYFNSYSVNNKLYCVTSYGSGTDQSPLGGTGNSVV